MEDCQKRLILLLALRRQHATAWAPYLDLVADGTFASLPARWGEADRAAAGGRGFGVRLRGAGEKLRENHAAQQQRFPDLSLEECARRHGLSPKLDLTFVVSGERSPSSSW